MKGYKVTIKINDSDIKLIIPKKLENNLFIRLIRSYDYNELFRYLDENVRNISVTFYINFIELSSFHADERDLYNKNPDTEGLYKKKVKDSFLLDRFTCINPQRRFYPLYAPILHMSCIDYFDEEVIKARGIILPRYIKYIDSSIWNYYVPFDRKGNSSKAFKDRFILTLSKIISNSVNGLYTINNAREYADLHARQAKQAFMSGVGAHTKNVSPHLFHSETEMEQLLISNEESKRIKKYFNDGFRWRMLIIDDFASEALKTYPKGGSNLSKTEIIVNILSKRFGLKYRVFQNSIALYTETDNKVKIWIDTISEIHSQAIELLKYRCYDIILLDYLLKYKNAVQREYSYELLDAIKGDKALQRLAGPFKKFWIFHISSFRSAIQERLQEKGYSYNDEFWQIGQGACPINTPELFEYRLYHFMDKQINSLSLSIRKNSDDLGGIFTLKELLDKIIDGVLASVKIQQSEIHSVDLQNLDAINSLSEHISKNFEVFLQIRGNYRILKNEITLFKEKKYSSILIKSIYKDMDRYENSFWEHLIHLMFLIAHGNAPQWHEMLEELYCLDGKDLEEVIEVIRVYILRLSKVYN